MSAAPLAVAAPRPALPDGRFLVAGLGAAGSAAAAALLGRREVSAWDGLTTPAAADRVERNAAALRARGVEVSTGGHGVALLDADPAPRCLVKSPGIPFEAPLVAAARERGLTVIDELELGWRLEPRPIVAVTGTNGKSTVAALVRDVLSRAGIEARLCGNTRFGPPLSAARELPGAALACEVSSFQLEGCPAFLPEVGVLTNFSHDHLYRHHTVQRYAEAKRAMFLRPEAAVGRAVLNVDDELGAAIADELAARGAAPVTYGRAAGVNWRLQKCEWSLDAARVEIDGPGGELELTTRLPGPHNALNAAAALACADACGIDPATAVAAVEAFPGVPGRFQRIEAASGFDVVVDYAHNPDGIVQALSTAAAITAPRGGRVIVVLSALDLYDAELCRAMGAAAARHSDLLVLTTERFSDGDAHMPVAGLAEGAAGGAASVEVIAERREAVAAATARARRGDLVLVLGRGERAVALHEPSGAVTAIDDAGLIAEALANCPGA